MVDEHGTWFKDHKTIMQVFTMEFSKKFKNDPEIAHQNAVTFFRYITEANNEWLTKDTTNEVIRQAIDQTSPLKAPEYIWYQKCKLFSMKKCWHILVRTFVYYSGLLKMVIC